MTKHTITQPDTGTWMYLLFEDATGKVGDIIGYSTVYKDGYVGGAILELIVFDTTVYQDGLPLDTSYIMQKLPATGSWDPADFKKWVEGTTNSSWPITTAVPHVIAAADQSQHVHWGINDPKKGAGSPWV